MTDTFTMNLNRRLLLQAATSTAALSATSGMALAAQPAEHGVGRNQSFDEHWKFFRGTASGCEAVDFNDHDWRSVDLPHDWSIEDLPAHTAKADAKSIGPFDPKAIGGTATGFAVGGEGWYRKHFTLAHVPDQRVTIQFEGVYNHSTVWINGHRLGENLNGYTPFAYDLSPYLVAGENVIAVQVTNLGENSRWYSGSGIYRHVWLDVLPQAASIARWGIAISTQEITQTFARVAIAAELENITPDMQLHAQVRDGHGHSVWSGAQPAAAVTQLEAQVPKPDLWSPSSPALYTLVTELRRGSKVLDRVETPFGIRIVAFSAQNGMTVNGVPMKLRGGCLHHAHGLLGAAAFDEAEDRKIRLLKARGFNAVRTAHNLYSPGFLAACDRHGMLVMCDTFDSWLVGKNPQDYAVDFPKHWREALTTILRSARNHPSIILWNIGNEVPARNLPSGVELQWELANLVHTIDPTRPVTAAVNNFAGRTAIPSEKTARPGRAGIADETSFIFLDVAGGNYKLQDYESDHVKFPHRIMVGTESFPKDVFEIWELTDRTPYLIGDFVWTAMDYLGEAGIGGFYRTANPVGMPQLASWPQVVSACGDIDLIGNQNPASLARDVAWNLSPLEITVQNPTPPGLTEVPRLWGWHDERTSWNWPDAQGKELTVRIYSKGDRIIIKRNGQTVSDLPLTPKQMCRTEAKVAYEAGVLEAIAYRNGQEIGRRSLVTTGPAATIVLAPEKATAQAGRGHISYVRLKLTDAKGKLVNTADNKVTVSVSGPGELIGFGTACATAHDSFQSNSTHAWRGEALAIIRSTGAKGTVHITAHSDGLHDAHASFTTH